MGNRLEQTLLYAGNPVYPTVLVHVTADHYGRGVSSENPIGADNQQERPIDEAWLNRFPSDLGNYVAGFVDGEGSFNVPIRREHDRTLPWRIRLSFNVSQVGHEMPQMLLESFEIGTTRGRSDGVWYYEVTKPDDLSARIFPFFERFPLRSPKANDLAVFETITELVLSGAHLTSEGFRRIVRLRSPMNRGGNRRRSDEELLAFLDNGNPQRPYAELPE